jgi:hypothetical protein
MNEGVRAKRLSLQEELYYMHGNHLGSVTLLTDGAGDVLDKARYYPCNGYRLPPTAGITDIGFTSHRQDNLDRGVGRKPGNLVVHICRTGKYALYPVWLEHYLPASWFQPGWE